MNYNDAVAVYQKSPTSETLKEVCKQLCSEMTLREKLKMLSGRQFAMRNCYDLLTKGRKYNYRPCIAGGIKRLEIPTVAFSDGPRGVVMGKSTCFPVSMARGASFNDELEYEVGTAIAKEAIAGGATILPVYALTFCAIPAGAERRKHMARIRFCSEKWALH